VDAAGRYHLTLISSGQRVMQGWWRDRGVAESKVTRWIGEHGEMPDPHLTLIDTETGVVLTSWPDEP
jgi:hypothetical protein